MIEVSILLFKSCIDGFDQIPDDVVVPQVNAQLNQGIPEQIQNVISEDSTKT